MNGQRTRSTADVAADILGINPKEAQQFLDALHSENPHIVTSAKEAIEEAFPAPVTKMALVEYAKAQVLDRLAYEHTKLLHEHKAVMAGESKTGCRHLANSENAIRADLHEMFAELDKRIALIEQKVLIYAAIALFILTPITSALTAALFAYLSKR